MIYEDEKKAINQKLDRLTRRKKIKKTDVLVLFGAGENSKIILKMLRERNFIHVMIVDNDAKKQGNCCAGIFVQSPDMLRAKKEMSYKVLLYSFYEEEISSQLDTFGYRKNRDYFLMRRQKRGSRSVLSGSIQVMQGVYRYREMKKSYPDGCRIFVCPYHGTGDAFLIGSMLHAYLQKNRIKDYVLAVASQACADVLKMFRIRHLLKMDKNRMEALIKAWVFAPELCGITVLNDSWMSIYTNPVQGLRGYKNLTFADMFRYVVFQLDSEEEYRLSKPLRKVHTHGTGCMAGEIDNKSIILSPYSNTLTEIPQCFWRKLACRLSRMGYRVYTNVAGAGELAVEGTKPLSFPLYDAVRILGQAAGFIGMRSGLCDVASAADTVKVILYDQDSYFYAGTARDYFGFARMGICHDAHEYSYENQDEPLIGKICLLFESQKEEVGK